MFEFRNTVFTMITLMCYRCVIARVLHLVKVKDKPIELEWKSINKNE